MYATNFYPVALVVLEHKKDENGLDSVDLNYYFKIHFLKKVPFLGGKIKSEGIKEIKAVLAEGLIPLIRETLSETITRQNNSSPTIGDIPKTPMFSERKLAFSHT